MGFLILDDLVKNLSVILDTPFSQLNIFVCMLLTFPLGYINRFLTNPKIRLLYGFITGAILQFQMYGISIFHVVVATLNTYFFIKYLGRKVSSFYVMAFNISHLSYLQIRNMIENYGAWTLGIETVYMMSICKFSSIAFNYEDGGKEESEINSSYHREKMIKEKPTLLETFSFIFFFPSSLIGPSFDFKDFKKFIYLEDEYQKINWKVCNVEALREFLIALFCMALKIKLVKYFYTSHCGSDEFVEYSLVYKYIYMVISMLVLRCTYYTGWKLSQASINFCGLSYNASQHSGHEKVQKEENCDKVESCNLVKIELAINPRTRIQYWNRTVHLWLKYHLFLRLININKKPFKNNKSIASLLTFLVSAIWHGFYPVYYLFFFEYYLIEQVSTFLDEQYDLFNKIEKWSFLPKLFYRILLMTIVNYFGLAFTILTLKENYNYYRAFYFIPVIGLLGAFILTLVLPKKRRGGANKITSVDSIDLKPSEITPEEFKIKAQVKTE